MTASGEVPRNGSGRSGAGQPDETGDRLPHCAALCAMFRHQTSTSNTPVL
jgi:hypothetical protein